MNKLVMAFFLILLPFSAMAIDSDMDGLSDAEEGVLGTDPLNPLDPPLMGVSAAYVTVGIDDTDFGTAMDNGSAQATYWDREGSFNKFLPLTPKPIDIMVSMVTSGRLPLYVCWLNASGIVCDGGGVNGGATPPAVTDGIKLVAGSLSHACVLGTTSGVQCWGDDSFGRAPASIPLNNPTDIAANKFHGCAIDSAGLHCWGGLDNSNGKAPPVITYGTLAEQQAGTAVLVTGDVPIRVAAGEQHTCVIVNTQAGGAAVRCFGDAVLPSGVGSTSKIIVPDSVTNPLRIAAGSQHTCVVNGNYSVPTSLSVICWGANDSYQTYLPANLINEPIDIRANGGHTCVVQAGEGHNTSSIAMKCWPVGLSTDLTYPGGAVADYNGDGLGDYQAVQLGLNPALTDNDADGLTDVQEIAQGTNPLNSDTDADGWCDGMGSACTNPDQVNDILPLVASNQGTACTIRTNSVGVVEFDLCFISGGGKQTIKLPSGNGSMLALVRASNIASSEAMQIGAAVDSNNTATIIKVVPQ